MTNSNATTDRLTLTQAARELGISRAAVFAAIRRGMLTPERVPTHLTSVGYYNVFDREQIERYKAIRRQSRKGRET